LTSRVLVLALSTGHKVGLALAGAAFIAFALGSSFLFPRFRPQYPGHGLRAFIVVAFVFFFGMLAAVEVFGAEPKEKEAAPALEATNQATSSTAPTTTEATTTEQATTTQATTAKTTTAPKAPPPAAAPELVKVTESEFKIVLASKTLKAGTATFQIQNAGAIQHDLAIVGGRKSKLIQPKGSGTLTAKLKPGTVELYCSVPGHKAAGMDIKVKVS
jgi:nitrite reductase (NO-forming)